MVFGSGGPWVVVSSDLVVADNIFVLASVGGVLSECQVAGQSGRGRRGRGFAGSVCLSFLG